MIKIAVVSYNPIYPYAKKKGIIVLSGKDILILPETFTKDGVKSREHVLPEDANWQELLQYKYSVEHVIIFAGKKESGALEIIKLAVESFAERKHVLFFVLCDHDLEEKKALLHELGVLDTQWMWFGDNHERCQETAVLKGFMHQFAETPSF